MLEKIQKTKENKKAYQDYKKRVAKLPKEYNIVINEIQAYLWSGALDGNIDILYDLLALFETAVADGKHVLDVTEKDVIVFCDELIKQWNSNTWQNTFRSEFNLRIHKKLDAPKNK